MTKRYLLTRNDVVDNLTSTDTTSPLSANQGKALKTLIDAVPSASGTPKKADSMVYYDSKWNLTPDYAYKKVTSFLSGAAAEITSESETGSIVWTEIGTFTTAPSASNLGDVLIKESGAEVEHRRYVVFGKGDDLYISAEDGKSGNPIVSWDDPVAIRFDTTTKKIYIGMRYTGTYTADVSIITYYREFDDLYIPTIPMDKVDGLDTKFQEYISIPDAEGGDAVINTSAGWTAVHKYGYCEYEQGFEADVTTTTPSSESSLHWESAGTLDPTVAEGDMVVLTIKTSTSNATKSFIATKISGDVNYLYLCDMNGSVPSLSYDWPVAVRLKIADDTLECVNQEAETWNLHIEVATNVKKIWKGYLPDMSSSVAWGDITGTLTAQTDLNLALSTKMPTPSGLVSDWCGVTYLNGAWVTQEGYAGKNLVSVITGDVTIATAGTYVDIGTTTELLSEGDLCRIVADVAGVGRITKEYPAFKSGSDPSILYIAANDGTSEPALDMANPVAVKIDSSNNVSITAVQSGISASVYIYRVASIHAFDSVYIPSLDATKITTGTFDAAQIPTIEQSKVSGLTSALSGKEPTISTKNSAFNKNFGTSADSVCEGNDSRLSNSRTPTNHASTHGNSGGDRITIDTSQVTSGTFDAGRIPSGAFQKLITVENETARKALTSTDVNNGDTVKQNDTGVMYFCIDNTKTSTDAGWSVYTAVTPWGSITSKPTTFKPEAPFLYAIPPNANLVKSDADSNKVYLTYTWELSSAVTGYPAKWTSVLSKTTVDYDTRTFKVYDSDKTTVLATYVFDRKLDADGNLEKEELRTS